MLTRVHQVILPVTRYTSQEIQTDYFYYLHNTNLTVSSICTSSICIYIPDSQCSVYLRCYNITSSHSESISSKTVLIKFTQKQTVISSQASYKMLPDCITNLRPTFFHEDSRNQITRSSYLLTELK